jgi:hypothetical protein
MTVQTTTVTVDDLRDNKHAVLKDYEGWTLTRRNDGQAIDFLNLGNLRDELEELGPVSFIREYFTTGTTIYAPKGS